MVYSPTSNNKSAYGDELTEDTWGQSSNLNAPPDYSTTNLGSLNKTSPYSSSDNSWGQQQPLSPSRPNLNNQNNQTLEVINSLTPEDILFVKTWQRDSFYFRVLPLSLASYGSLWWFNKTKGLPNKPGRYVLVSIAAYFLGKLSYKEEFKRRLMENSSNTPFMQAARQKLNVPFTANSFGSGANLDYSAENDFSNLNSPSGFSDSSALGRETFPFNEFNQTTLDSDKPVSIGGNEPLQRPSTSYDELRARNRGFTT